MRPHFEYTTVFAGSEGECEEVFLKYLRSKFSKGKAKVTVKFAGGKSPEYIIKKSIDQRANFSFTHSFVLLDTDKPWGESEKALAKKEGFELVGSSPCLEGLLLEVLGHKILPSMTSKECKELFQKRYNGGKNVLTENVCKKLLNIKVIQNARKKIPTLNRLVECMEGIFSKK